MKRVVYLALSLLLVGCEQEQEITEAPPLLTQTVVEVGACTPQQVAWDRTVRSECAVKMDNGAVKVLPAPITVGMKFITCPERTNNIDNERCVIWYGARKNWKQV